MPTSRTVPTSRSVPDVIGHRGASGAFPPGNTVAAFRGAAQLGADGVELDVRRAADGSLVVHHDPDLPDGRPIRSLVAGDLPEWVPLLDTALAVCAEVDLTVNVEIKNSPLEADFDEERTLVDDVLAALDGWDPGDLLISSFDPETVAKVRASGSEIPTGLLVWDPTTVSADLVTAAAAGHISVNPWLPCVDAAVVQQARDLGLAINVWTVDEPEDMSRLIDFGVAGIITNTPDVLRSLVS